MQGINRSPPHVAWPVVILYFERRSCYCGLPLIATVIQIDVEDFLLDMDNAATDYLTSLFGELRKESIEANRMRSQTIGFKITFVSASVGFVVHNLHRAFGDSIGQVVNPYYFLLFFIPAFASVFFDLLIIGYSITISRIGLYCRKYLEPSLPRPAESFRFWEEFMTSHRVRHRLGIAANLGITGLAISPALFVSIEYFIQSRLVLVMGSILIISYVYLFIAFSLPGTIVNEKRGLIFKFFVAKPVHGEIKKEYISKENNCKVTFRLNRKAVAGAESVHLVGDFNDWNQKETKMTKTKDGGFECTLSLDRYREYQFRYLINGNRWENDWNADKYVWNPDGDQNSVVIV